MPTLNYDPFQALNQIHRELNQYFDRPPAQGNTNPVPASDWTPAVDIKEENNQFLIHADVPGVKPDDIEVTMENGVLTIKGERATETSSESPTYSRFERVRGTFLRRFTMPDTADEDAITAKTQDGVLEVTIPKREKAQPKKVTVQT